MDRRVRLRGFRLGFVWGVLGLALGAYAADPAAQSQYDFANGLLQRGFYEEAAEEYAEYLERFPSGEFAGVARYRMAEAKYGAKDYEGALAGFEAVLNAPPDEATRVRAQLGKGEVLYLLKRQDEAASTLTSIAANVSDPALKGRALYYLGKACFENGDAASSAKAFDTLVTTLPDNPFVPYAQYQLGFVYLAMDQAQKAADAFSAVASTNADEALRRESLFRAAEAYDKLGQHDTAAVQYQKLQAEAAGTPYAERAAYGLIWSQYYAGNYAAAMEAARGFLASYPETEHAAGLQYLIGNALQQLKRYDEAIESYRKILAAPTPNEFTPRAMYKEAWLLHLQGNDTAAAQRAQAFLDSYKDHPMEGDASFLLGTIHASQGNFEDAYEEFHLVASKYPNSEFAGDALYKAAEALGQLGRTDEAAAMFEEFAKRYPSHALTEQAVLRAGDAEFLSASFDEAIAKYNEILAGEPSADVVEETLYRLAITYHNKQDFAGSAEAFGRLLERFPGTSKKAEAHRRIADYALREGGDPGKAIDHYQASLAAGASGKDRGACLKGLALAQYEAQQYDAAAETFGKLLSDHPDVALNAETYLWLGQYLFDKGRWAEAAGAWNALLSASPEYEKRQQVRLQIGEALEHAGQMDEALAAYRAAINVDEASGLALQAKFNLGKILESQNKLDEAVSLYEEASRGADTDTASRAQFRLGELYTAQGKPEEAARAYMRVAILYMHEELSPESLWRAGQAFEEAQRPDDATKAYQELVSSYAGSEPATKAQARLDAIAGAS